MLYKKILQHQTIEGFRDEFVVRIRKYQRKILTGRNAISTTLHRHLLIQKQREVFIYKAVENLYRTSNQNKQIIVAIHFFLL